MPLPEAFARPLPEALTYLFPLLLLLPSPIFTLIIKPVVMRGFSPALPAVTALQIITTGGFLNEGVFA